MTNSNGASNPTVIKKIDIFFAFFQYSIMIFNALLILNNFVFISLNMIVATLYLVSLIFLWKIRNPYYPYLIISMMICYIFITAEIIFDTNGTFAWYLLQIILNILLFPWLIYAIKFFRVPLEGRDKILRMWTTSSFVEDEKEREDNTDGIDHTRVKLSKKKK